MAVSLKDLAVIFICIVILVSCATIHRSKNQLWDNYDNIKYGNHELQYVDITIPKTNTKQLNAIIFIHGIRGIIDFTLLDDCYRDTFVVGVMNYRSVNQNGIKTADIINDVDNAINAMKIFTLGNGISINKIIIMGFSLGGGIGLLYSYNFLNNDSIIPIAFCVNISGFTNLTDASLMGTYNADVIRRLFLYAIISKITGESIKADDLTIFGFTERITEIVKKISPVYLVDENSPPTITIHNTGDKIVPFSQAISLNTALEKANVPQIFIPVTNNPGHYYHWTEKKNYTGKSTKRIITFNKELEVKIIEGMNKFIELYCN
jgi:acetyl esterase/lipase